MRLLQPNRTKLDIYRRHLTSCPYKDPQYMKCDCPLWVYGWLRGERVPRKSLGTSDLAEAAQMMALLQDPETPSLKPILEAVEACQKHNLGLAANTQRRYTHVLAALLTYCAKKKLKYMADLKVETLDDFRATRRIAPRSSAKELVILRMFFAFALERKWIAENTAKRIKPPRNIKPPEIVPYSQNEMTSILAACEGIGDSAYERKRARAMILLMIETGLRISDAATLRKDRVPNGRIFLRTLKTGGMVFQPVVATLQKALDAVPAARGAGENPRCYFWNEVSSRSTMERMLRAVFKRSGVKGAHAHRFRHTLATDMLGEGYSTKEVVDRLGISEAVVIEH
jgi:site-specific recombinase XerD